MLMNLLDTQLLSGDQNQDLENFLEQLEKMRHQFRTRSHCLMNQPRS